MASSGVVSAVWHTGYTVAIHWSQTKKESANTSDIHWSVVLSGKSGYDIIANANKTLYVTINGETIERKVQISIPGGGSRTLATGALTIPHDADGGKSLTIGGSLGVQVTIRGTYHGTIRVPEKSFTLDTIARKATISAFPSFNIKDGATVTIARQSTAYTHSVALYCGSKFISSKTATSHSVTFSASEIDGLYASINAAMQGAVRAVVTTKSGSLVIGADERTATARVESSLTPKISNIVIRDTSGKVPDGSFLKGVSNIAISFQKAAQKGAWITEFYVAYKGITQRKESFTISKIPYVGKVELSFYTRDSRGLEVRETRTITILDYAPPQVESLQFHREDNTGNWVDDTTASYVAAAFQVKPGGYTGNGKTATFEIREAGSVGAWSRQEANLIEWEKVQGIRLAGDPFKSYEVRLKVSDGISETMYYGYSNAVGITVHLEDGKVGIGKLADRGMLDVGGDIFSKGKKVLTESLEMVENTFTTQGAESWYTVRYSNGVMIQSVKKEYKTPYSFTHALYGVYTVGSTMDGSSFIRSFKPAFVKEPQVTASVMTSWGAFQPMGASIFTVGGSSVKVTPYAFRSGSFSFGIVVHAIGRWK